LAAQYAPALCIAPDDKEYGVFLNWLYHADATLTFPQAICLRYTQLQPGRADAAVSDYLQFHLGRLRLLDSALQDGREFLVGGRFTVADVCVAYSLYLGQSIVVAGRPMSAAYSAPAQAYLARMAGREGFQRALAAQAQITV
jgi:glutathione S-transferase